MSDENPTDDGVVEILSIGDEVYEGEAGKEDGAGPLPPEAVQEEVTRLQEEAERFRELYLRKLADFDNYRKRSNREMAEARRFANAELLRECLPVVDNLERALSVPLGDSDGLSTGVDLVLRQFKDVLSRFGLEEVSPLGQPFDPTVHEAVARSESTTVEANHVANVLQKGYLLGEKLLRPALVEVAVASREGEEAPEATQEEGQ